MCMRDVPAGTAVVHAPGDPTALYTVLVCDTLIFNQEYMISGPEI